MTENYGADATAPNHSDRVSPVLLERGLRVLPVVSTTSEEKRWPACSDEELMLGIADRDREAMTAFFDRYQDAVFRFALARLRRRNDAMDILADVMLTVWEKPGAFRGTSLVKTWLLGIAWNKMRSGFRKNKRPHDELNEDNGGSITLEEEALAGTERRALLSCWEKLSKMHREVLHLAYFADHASKEIAAITGVPEGTVKSRTHYAVRVLRKCLESLERKGHET